MGLFLEFKKVENRFKVKLTEFVGNDGPLSDETFLQDPFKPLPGFIIDELGQESKFNSSLGL